MIESTNVTTAKPPKIEKLGVGADGLPLSRCRVCDSTNRAPYTESSRQFIDGRLHIWLRTRCLDCEQSRVDRIVKDIPQRRR